MPSNSVTHLMLRVVVVLVVLVQVVVLLFLLDGVLVKSWLEDVALGWVRQPKLCCNTPGNAH